jgi:preprotein translocase subunit SecF
MNIMKFRPLFFTFSLSLILISVFSIIKWGFVPSVDFAGGTVWEIKLSDTVNKSQIEKIYLEQEISLTSISTNGNNYVIKSETISPEIKANIEISIKKIDPKYQEQRFESLGPSLGKELIIKTVVAIILSSISLLFFIARRFREPTFGISAILAMFHDTIILIGSFSLFGHFFGAELDALFVTALLTTLSASVHDTVVTFDRIRELKRRNYRQNWVELSNQAVMETIVRSVNNSMTIIFMLLALVILGGSATRWFSTALLVGVIAGTYSSTAVAIPLVLFFKRKEK